jgi:hypothetical protein
MSHAARQGQLTERAPGLPRNRSISNDPIGSGPFEGLFYWRLNEKKLA